MRPSPLAAALFAIIATTANGQLAPHQIPKPAPPSDHAANLPVTHVSLYKNGVGFFEHTGHVTGDSSVTIDFTTDQLNDVLQSLTAIDLNGGRISGAGYNSTTPLEQQLKSLPLALSEDMTAADFYAAIRGSRIEVTTAGASITGRLLSVEDRSAATTKESSDDSKADRHFLTVVSDSGEVRTLELTPATSVHLLDSQLHQDVTRYLQLLADSRSQGLRHLTLGDRGTGSRELHISYISAVPIWKSTYRILFTDKSTTATIQGWAVVDNTVGEDWNNVQLSLIAGAPQSFIQPLSDPIYTSRVEIPIAQDAQLTSQTFESSIDAQSATVATVIDNKLVQSLPVDGNNVITLAALLPGTTNVSRTRAHGVLGGIAGARPGPMAPPPPPPTYEEAASASTAPEAKAAAFDDFFSYNLTEPVTIRKNESALVPILQAKISADPVTLVSTNGSNISQPLRALWITNTTDLTLDRGSFTLIENGAFGGEGLLDPIHAGEKRLLSYAADQAVHISSKDGKTNSKLTFLHANGGYLMIHHGDSREITYLLHNAAATSRTVLLEYPIEKGFTLDDATPKPSETTPSVYRFRVEVASGQTASLHIGGVHNTFESYLLSAADDNQIAFFLSTTHNDPTLVAALKPIIAARKRVAEAQDALNQTNAHLNALRSDEDRQRANITALQNADKEARERFVHDLNKTEDAITAAQSDLATRQAALEAAKSNLATTIDNFSIDTRH